MIISFYPHYNYSFGKNIDTKAAVYYLITNRLGVFTSCQLPNHTQVDTWVKFIQIQSPHLLVIPTELHVGTSKTPVVSLTLEKWGGRHSRWLRFANAILDKSLKEQIRGTAFSNLSSQHAEPSMNSLKCSLDSSKREPIRDRADAIRLVSDNHLPQGSKWVF